MPFVNIPKMILEEHNFWPIERTYYELFPIDQDIRVYLFACHQGHTDVRMKISLYDLLKLDI